MSSCSQCRILSTVMMAHLVGDEERMDCSVIVAFVQLKGAVDQGFHNG